MANEFKTNEPKKGTVKIKDAMETLKDDFALFIATAVHDETHYTSIMPPVNVVRETWRNTAAYSDEIRDLLIQKSKTFIRISSNPHKANNIDTLHALAKWIAKYLAIYTEQDSKYDDVRAPDTNAAWYAARKDLVNALYYDFDFIKQLKQNLQQKRQERGATRKFYRERAQAAANLEAGFVCRGTSNGNAMVCRTTNANSNQMMGRADSADIERALNEFDATCAKTKRPRTSRSR